MKWLQLGGSLDFSASEKALSYILHMNKTYSISFVAHLIRTSHKCRPRKRTTTEWMDGARLCEYRLMALMQKEWRCVCERRCVPLLLAACQIKWLPSFRMPDVLPFNHSQSKVSISSDAYGSLPVFNDQGLLCSHTVRLSWGSGKYYWRGKQNPSWVAKRCQES